MAKILAGTAVVYALSPIDLIPDFIPVIGYLDDLILLPLLVALTLKLIPDETFERCRGTGKADVPAGHEKALVLYAADYFDLGYLNFACGKTAVLLKRSILMANWNPWHGCRKYSEGCQNCYVYRMDEATEENAAADFSGPRLWAALGQRPDRSYVIPPGSSSTPALPPIFCWRRRTPGGRRPGR